MKHIISDYLSQMLQSNIGRDFNEALRGLDCCLTDEMNECLISEPKGDEIKDALFQMHPTKASDLYGFHGLFYHNFGMG